MWELNPRPPAWKAGIHTTTPPTHVKDGSVARFVLNVVVVELTNDGELIRSNDGVSVSMFVLDPFGGIESLNFGVDKVFDAGLWEWAEQDVVVCCAKLG